MLLADLRYSGFGWKGEIRLFVPADPATSVVYAGGHHRSGLVPANQNEEGEVRKRSGKESRTGSRTPVGCK